MAPTRRDLLAAPLAVTAGCSTPEGTSDPTGTTGSLTPTSPDATATPDEPTQTPAREYIAWRRQLPYEELGILVLGGGPETPSIFATSAPGDGTSDDHALHALTLQEGETRWRLGLADPVRTSPTYLDTEDGPRVLVATWRGNGTGEESIVHAIDPAARERVWRFEPDTEGAVFPIATGEQRVFVGRRDDQLRQRGAAVTALGGAEATEQWTTETGDVARRGSARRRETLLVDTHGRLEALGTESGDDLWTVPAASQAYDNRAERVFVQQEGVVRGLDLADGSDLWRRAFDFEISRITTPRQAMDGTVFVGDRDGRLLALSPLEGDTRWTLSVPSSDFVPTVERTSERLFVAGAGLQAVDPVSGEREWSFTPDVEGTVDVETGAPSTVFARTGGHVWALDPATGDRRWQFDPGGAFAGVASAGDFAFVGVGGAVYALDGSEAA